MGDVVLDRRVLVVVVNGLFLWAEITTVTLRKTRIEQLSADPVQSM